MKKLLIIALGIAMPLIADDIIKKPQRVLSRADQIEAAERAINLIEENELFSLQLMLSDGYSPNLKDARGLSLAEAAVINGNIEALQLLKQYGADFTGLLGRAVKINELFKDETTQAVVDYLKKTNLSVVD